MRGSIACAAACAAIVACRTPSKSVEPAPIAADPSSSAKTEDTDEPEDVVDFGEPGPLVVTPPVPPFTQKLPMDHAHQLGWSADGSTLGACDVSPITTFCTLFSREGKTESIDDGNGTGFIDPKKQSILDARLKALGLHVPATSRWRFARDVEVTWTVTTSSATTAPIPTGILRIGARVRGGPTSWVITMSHTKPGSDFYEIHPEAIALSPDGALLGVVAHAFAGEFNNAFPMRMIAVNELAAHAYNDAGFAHHQKEEWAASADDFHKATTADPTFGLAHYNLACAYARLGDARAQDELKKAIALGDAVDVKTRATSDVDFTSVKTQGWFVELVK